MMTRVSVARPSDWTRASVTVEGHGTTPDDLLYLVTECDDDEVSEASHEAHSIAHAWWRHGWLGIVGLSGLSFPWRLYGGTEWAAGAVEALGGS